MSVKTLHFFDNSHCLSAFVAATLIFALSACGEKATPASVEVTPVPTAAVAFTPQPTAVPSPSPTPEPVPTVETVHFSASGDNLIHDGLYLQAQERGNAGYYNFTYAYDNLRDFYGGFDVNWLNQETLVNDEYEPSTYPCFSTPGDVSDALYDVGFRVFSLSNNHSYDLGAGGIAASMRHWQTLPKDVYTMGFYNLDSYNNYCYQTVNGVTIGYLSYTEYTNGISTPANTEYGVVYLDDTEIIAAQMAAVRPNCDVLVVSCHWGVEGSHVISGFQRRTAQWLADRGADLIIGTHPHVIQDAEWLTAADGHQTFAVYSLGNFISSQSEIDNMIGTILDVTFEKTTEPDGRSWIAVKEPKLHAVITHYDNHYKNIRDYLYRDYTDELGAQHGVFIMTREYIQGVLNDSINQEFLADDSRSA